MTTKTDPIAELELAIQTQTGQKWTRTDPLYVKDRCYYWQWYQWPAHCFEDLGGQSQSWTTAMILDALRTGQAGLYRWV